MRTGSQTVVGGQLHYPAYQQGDELGWNHAWLASDCFLRYSYRVSGLVRPTPRRSAAEASSAEAAAPLAQFRWAPEVEEAEESIPSCSAASAAQSPPRPSPLRRTPSCSTRRRP